MPFTLYSAGTTSKESTDYKRKIGYPQLLSQYLEKKNILDWVEYLKTHPECKSKLFIDSGAFTAHTKGVDIPVDSYIEFVNSIDTEDSQNIIELNGINSKLIIIEK